MTLTNQVACSIQRFAREAYPHECCGALIGATETATEVLALPNTTEEGTRRRFRIRPEDYRRVEAHAEAGRKELLGFYHSHPDHPAWPSLYDLEHAWPNLVYLIISVNSDRTGALTAWRLAENRSRFEQEPLSILKGE